MSQLFQVFMWIEKNREKIVELHNNGQLNTAVFPDRYQDRITSMEAARLVGLGRVLSHKEANGAYVFSINDVREMFYGIRPVPPLLEATNQPVTLKAAPPVKPAEPAPEVTEVNDAIEAAEVETKPLKMESSSFTKKWKDIPKKFEDPTDE